MKFQYHKKEKKTRNSCLLSVKFHIFTLKNVNMFGQTYKSLTAQDAKLDANLYSLSFRCFIL